MGEGHVLQADRTASHHARPRPLNAQMPLNNYQKFTKCTHNEWNVYVKNVNEPTTHPPNTQMPLCSMFGEGLGLLELGTMV